MVESLIISFLKSYKVKVIMQGSLNAQNYPENVKMRNFVQYIHVIPLYIGFPGRGVRFLSHFKCLRYHKQVTVEYRPVHCHLWSYSRSPDPETTKYRVLSIWLKCSQIHLLNLLLPHLYIQYNGTFRGVCITDCVFCKSNCGCTQMTCNRIL